MEKLDARLYPVGRKQCEALCTNDHNVIDITFISKGSGSQLYLKLKTLSCFSCDQAPGLFNSSRESGNNNLSMKRDTGSQLFLSDTEASFQELHTYMNFLGCPS
jgi:hypothetical protein